jgi:hypothetical protein
VYDDADGGHLRIEMRALPAGPTTTDMVAGAAFAVGLTLGLAPRAGDLVSRITFGQARRNFYQAARFGLSSELIWPEASRTHPVPTTKLIPILIPVARDGLRSAGVTPAEADAWLSVVANRVERGVTGSRWQRACFEQAKSRFGTARASSEMLERYMSLALQGRPVAEWPA